MNERIVVFVHGLVPTKALEGSNREDPYRANLNLGTASQEDEAWQKLSRSHSFVINRRFSQAYIERL